MSFIRTKSGTIITTILVLLFTTGIILGNTIQIPTDQPTIQAGIDAAVPGDTVLVADGTYTGDGNRDIDFGGKNIVLISENGPEVTIIDCEGSEVSPHRGFNFHSGEDTTAVIDGFTIMNGYAPVDTIVVSESKTYFIGYGGGILVDSSSLRIQNCIIENCRAITHGGAISLQYTGPPSSSNVFINKCVIRNNSASRGGGINLSNSAGSIVRNTIFNGNVAVSYIEPFVPYFHRSGQGGASHCTGSALYENCTFVNNSAEQGGDEDASSGGALYGGFEAIRNCLFSNNHASGSPDISHFSYIAFGEISCTNIFDGVGNQWAMNGLDSLSNINNNFSADPLFCDTADGDFHISSLSPCAPENNSCGELVGALGVGCEPPELIVEPDSLYFEPYEGPLGQLILDPQKVNVAVTGLDSFGVEVTSDQSWIRFAYSQDSVMYCPYASENDSLSFDNVATPWEFCAYVDGLPLLGYDSYYGNIIITSSNSANTDTVVVSYAPSTLSYGDTLIISDETGEQGSEVVVTVEVIGNSWDCAGCEDGGDQCSPPYILEGNYIYDSTHLHLDSTNSDMTELYFSIYENTPDGVYEIDAEVIYQRDCYFWDFLGHGGEYNRQSIPYVIKGGITVNNGPSIDTLAIADITFKIGKSSPIPVDIIVNLPSDSNDCSLGSDDCTVKSCYGLDMLGVDFTWDMEALNYDSFTVSIADIHDSLVTIHPTDSGVIVSVGGHTREGNIYSGQLGQLWLTPGENASSNSYAINAGAVFVHFCQIIQPIVRGFWMEINPEILAGSLQVDWEPIEIIAEADTLIIYDNEFTGGFNLDQMSRFQIRASDNSTVSATVSTETSWLKITASELINDSAIIGDTVNTVTPDLITVLLDENTVFTPFTQYYGKIYIHSPGVSNYDSVIVSYQDIVSDTLYISDQTVDQGGSAIITVSAIGEDSFSDVDGISICGGLAINAVNYMYDTAIIIIDSIKEDNDLNIQYLYISISENAPPGVYEMNAEVTFGYGCFGWSEWGGTWEYLLLSTPIVKIGAITVTGNANMVFFDIKPGSCPNPIIIKDNGKGNAVVPAAILGTDDFDVHNIDINSLRLAGVAPLRWSYEDETSPIDSGDSCACTEEGPDGFDDLILKFDKSAVIAAITAQWGNPELTITGLLSDSTPIAGSDCIEIRPKNTDVDPVTGEIIVIYATGDVTGDGMVNLHDVATIIAGLYGNSPVEAGNLSAGDVNCSDNIDLLDITSMINYLFKNGPEPGCL